MDSGSWQATVHGAARVRQDLANKRQQQQGTFSMYDLWSFISFFAVLMLFIFLALFVRIYRQYILNQIFGKNLYVISLNFISISTLTVLSWDSKYVFIRLFDIDS